MIHVLAVLPVLLPSAAPQGSAYQWPVLSSGSAISSAGDADGDGRCDFALGQNIGSQFLFGRVELRSGRDGSSLWLVTGPVPGDGFGSAVAPLGDVDGDGHDDLAVGAPYFGSPNVPAVYALSGRDGSTLWQRDSPSDWTRFGHSLARLEDLDQDGVDDLVAGGPGQVAGGAWILSGSTGAVLLALQPPPFASNQFADCVAAIGDLDGDGVGDIAVGDRGYHSSTGRVSLHSGATGSLLSVWDPPPPGAGGPTPGSFGATIAGMPDLNMDGVPDLVVGAPKLTWGIAPSGRVWILSGVDGSPLHELAPGAGASLIKFGSQVSAFDDLDGDGLPDVAVSAGTLTQISTAFGNAGIRVYSSATGQWLRNLGRRASRFAVVPDDNGDGVVDALVTDFTKPGVGYVVVLALTDVPMPKVWSHCPSQPSSNGCEPVLQVQGASSLTHYDDLEVSVVHLPLGAAGLCIYGPSRALTPFASSTLCVAAPFQRTPLAAASIFPQACPGTTGIPAAFHSAWTKSDLKSMGLAPGESFFVQAWYRDPGLPPPLDFGLTGAIEIPLWP